MIIIIEGPDGAGKTTLANKIAKQLNFEIIHMSYPKTEDEKVNMYCYYLELIKESKNKNIILDRAWYSEMVYGPIKRDKSYISTADMKSLELHVLDNGGGAIIHCTGNVGSLYIRSKERGEDYIGTIEELESIVDSYKELFDRQQCALPIFEYVVRLGV